MIESETGREDPRMAKDNYEESYEYERALRVLRFAIKTVEFYKAEAFNECDLPLLHKVIRSSFGYE